MPIPTVDIGPGRFVFENFVSGTDLAFSFNMTDQGVPIDISGDTFEAFIAAANGDLHATCTYDAEIQRVVVSWTEVQTATLPPGCWKIWVYRTSGDSTTVPILGKIEVNKGGK